MSVARVEFAEEALDEILAAEEWYGARGAVAEAAITESIDAALRSVADFPLSGHPYLHGTE